MVFSAKEMEAAWNSKSVYVCLCMIVGVDEFLSHVNGAYMDFKSWTVSLRQMNILLELNELSLLLPPLTSPSSISSFFP